MSSPGQSGPLARPQTTQTTVSFDIFDTLLLRLVTSGDAVATLVANRLAARNILPTPPIQYAAARVRAEREAASALAGRPATLDDILDHLGEPYVSTPGFATLARIEEIRVEHELLRLVPGAVGRVNAERRAGKQIAFVSDMHLPASELEAALRRFELFRDGDRLLVSCEIGKSKSTEGQLFAHFLEANELDVATTTHVGNDGWSDIKMAKKHGLKTVHLPAANPNRYEAVLEDHSVTSGGFTSLLAGAARATRLSTLECAVPPSRKRAQQIQTVASDVAAPVMLGFVLWALRRCHQLGVRRAYFLTRDGELPFEIASRLPAELTKGIELRMLGVGRSAIALPAASVVDYSKWHATGFASNSFIGQHSAQVDASQLLRRVGLDTAHGRALVEQQLTVPDRPFTDAEFEQWKSACATGEIREAILEESRRRLPAVLDYFTQEGLADGERTAMIDVGWTGQQAAMLTALVAEAGGAGPVHLHVGRRGAAELLHEAEVEQWLFDEAERPAPIGNPVALFEAFCVTLEQSVNGYERHDGVMVPVRRARHHSDVLQQWGQEVLRESILATVDRVLFDADLAPWDADLTGVAAALLQKFWDSPTTAEADAWGAFPFEQDQLGAVVRTLAVRYELKQLQSRRAGEFHGLDWKAGSVAISAPPVRLALKAGEAARSSLRARRS